MILGNKAPRYLDEPRSVIGTISRAPAGNLILRVGRENHPLDGWRQTEHVVLTVDEAHELIGHALKQLAEIKREGSDSQQPFRDSFFEAACAIARAHEEERQQKGRRHLRSVPTS